MTSAIRIYGVRHHGPGCARSLALALQENPPDILLVEGPPEADGLLEFVGDAELIPPVAILVYAQDAPAQASFYPFAQFSPEWQALLYARQQNVPLRFFDLPAAVRLAHRIEQEAQAEALAAELAKENQLAQGQVEQDQNQVAAEDTEQAVEQTAGATAAQTLPETQPETPSPSLPQEAVLAEDLAAVHLDPLDHYAKLAGFDDGESWWDALIEQRQHGSDLFAVVLEAMRDLRAATPEMDAEKQLWEDRREAAMRQQIRAAQKEGFQNIAVICGAWHAPALEKLPAAKQDAALLKDLKKCKVAATWVPWNYQRLCAASGYGAGITSPGWYEFLWQQQQAQADIAAQLAERWLSHVAHLLRKQDFNASPAEVIDAVRLANMLAHLNGRGKPGLQEFNQASSAVLCMGDAAPLAVIRKELIVGDRLGQVPESTPAAPIARDLAAQQKSLRLKASALEQDLNLDLRNANDLARSHLLHRLVALDIPWGKQLQVRGKRGSFHEAWQLLWQPEFAVSLIEAGRYGQTVQAAAQSKLLEAIYQAQDLPQLSKFLQQILLADLAEILPLLLNKLADLAAQSADIVHLLQALPPLFASMRYGSVRQIDRSLIEKIVHAIVARVVIGLPNACVHISTDAAKELLPQIDAVNLSLNTEQNEEDCAAWRACLQQIAALAGGQALLLGRCHRLLLDAQEMPEELLRQRLSLALSHPEPEYCADWLEGLLAGSGLLLLNDDQLWRLLNDWLMQLKEEEFVRVLPLLRRAFSQFPPGERQMLGQRASQRGKPVSQQEELPFNLQRAQQILPLARAILALPDQRA